MSAIRVRTKVVAKLMFVQRWMDIKKGINRGLVAATRLLFENIRHRISVWGSTPIAPGIRRIRTVSSPGDSPLRQTGNLYNSLKHKVNKNRMVGRVWVPADVTYAQTLEFGGMSVGSVNKKHTFWTLEYRVKPRVIAARPFMRPGFEATRNDAITLIRNSIRAQLFLTS